MTNKKIKNAWFSCEKHAPNASLRLFCFSYAGGNAMMFRPWQEFFWPKIEVCPLQIPGHGTRLGEAPFTRMRPLVQAMVGPMMEFLDRPFAFFGHSMGAILAFELAHALRSECGLTPSHLFVSGRPAPHRPLPPPLHNLPRPQLLEELRRLKGTPDEVLQHEELLEVLIPLLRADFEVIETYEYVSRPKLACPITAFGGIEDLRVSRTDLEGWAEHGSGGFSLRMLNGDHFFIHKLQAQLLQMVSEEIQPLVGLNNQQLCMGS